VAVRARAVIQARVNVFLEKLGRQVVGSVVKVAKAGHEDDHDPLRIVEAADFGALEEEIRPELRKVARDAAKLGLEQVDAAVEKLLEQADARAIEWADKRAGELITQVADTTRDRVRELVSSAEEEGWSNDRLATEIEDDSVFSEARAETVARTETAMADVQGNLIGWQEAGVVAQKEWKVAQDGECDDCQAMDGQTVDIDESFEGGDPPLHPNCRCDVLPVLAEADAAPE